MVKHTNSPLWQAWYKHVYHDFPKERLPPNEFFQWISRKCAEWRQMKKRGEIDVKKLSIANRVPYHVLTGRYKPGRKRGRRRKRAKPSH